MQTALYMKSKSFFHTVLVLYLIVMLPSYVLGQQSPEVGKWFSVNNIGDSIFYEFTPEGEYVFRLSGDKPLVPLKDKDNASVEPTSALIFTYEADYSTIPHAIDFYDQNGQIFNKGIFEITPEGNMRICVDRFGVERPTEFIFLDHRRDTRVLSKVPTVNM